MFLNNEPEGGKEGKREEVQLRGLVFKGEKGGNKSNTWGPL